MQAVEVGHKSSRGPQKHRKPAYKYINGLSKHMRRPENFNRGCTKYTEASTSIEGYHASIKGDH